MAERTSNVTEAPPRRELAITHEIVTTRVLIAPRELVFEAWTDPDQLVHWWGPKGFTSSIYEFNPKPGGIWRYIMHGPNGVDCHNRSVFVEVVKPEWIVLDHVSRPQFRVVATFAAEAGSTRLTFRMLFKSAAECEKAKTYAVAANEQSFDRLEAHLVKMALTGGPEISNEGDPSLWLRKAS